MKKSDAKSTSLLITILVSFLLIIFVSSFINIFAFAVFKNEYQGEIIRNNRLLLKNMSDRYENYFANINTMLFDVYHQKNIAGFHRQLQARPDGKADFRQGREIVSVLQNRAFHPQLFLDNVVVYYGSEEMIFDKEGSSGAEMFFNRLYASGAYPHSFWKQMLTDGKNVSAMPAAEFHTQWGSSSSKQIMPIVFKLPGSSYLLAAFVDMEKTHRTFFGQTEDTRSIAILDRAGNPIYSSSETSWAEAVSQVLDNRKEYLVKDGYYYFAEKGTSGFTYLTAVSDETIHSQMTKLNASLFVMFALSFVVGAAVAYTYSRKINRSVKEVISALKIGQLQPSSNSISEFTFIHQKIDELIKEKESVRNELLKHQSVMTGYIYISKLKNINSDINEWKDFIVAQESFIIIMYEFRFRADSSDDMQMTVVNYFREHIDFAFGESFNDFSTFQIEKNQMMTVIKQRVEKEKVREVLEKLQPVLDHEKDTCFVTAAVSSWFDHSLQFNYAYRQVQELIHQAKLIEETQIILEPRKLSPSYGFDPGQEQQFSACLMSCDEEGAVHLITQCLDEMHAKQASVPQFRKFAESISDKVWTAMDSANIEPDQAWSVKPLLSQLSRCASLEEYKRAFRPLMHAAVSLLLEKKKDADPILDFVMNTLNTKYAEDLSLDQLADQLRLSNTYLSAYIKEKTGANFTDHLQRIRIRKAQELLEQTEINVNDISLQTGYRNITSFNRMFKKWTGMTPSEYRKKSLVSV